MVVLSAVDPLNLTGITLPGPRLPAIPGHRLLLRNGVVVARLQGGEISFQEGLDDLGRCLAGSLLNEDRPIDHNVTADQRHGLRSVGA